MTQQLGIVIIIDQEQAARERTLAGCTYLFDNAGPFGSIGQGTDHLVSAINGTYWSDGSQATQPILNYLVTGISSLPITLPRSFRQIRALHTVAALGVGAAPAMASALGAEKPVRLDHFGAFVAPDAEVDPFAEPHPAPIITGISGEAVEQGIIFPAQYGSPDLVSGGWYWSATVATSRPRVWPYMLHIDVHRAAGSDWEPVPLTLHALLNVTSKPLRNGFTGGGTGLLPIGMPY